MSVLVEMFRVGGYDVGRACPVCTKAIGKHDTGELLWCLTLYGAAEATRSGVQRQLKRRVGRLRRGKR